MLLFDFVWLSQFNHLSEDSLSEIYISMYFFCLQEKPGTDVKLDVLQLTVYWIMSDAKTTKNAYFQITNEKGRDVHTEFLYMLDRVDEENKL